MAQAHQTNVQRLEAELAGLREEACSERAKNDERQKQLATREAMLEKRRVQLRQAASNAEFQALKDEIAATEMANSVLEDEILESMDKLDELNAKVAKAEAAAAKAQREADGARLAIEEQGPQIQGEIERLGIELRQTEADLPGEFRELYRRVVRQRGQDALASVHGEFCQGCNQHVPVNLINELLLNRPTTCKVCGRLLYLPEDYTPR